MKYFRVVYAVEANGAERKSKVQLCASVERFEWPKMGKKVAGDGCG